MHGEDAVVAAAVSDDADGPATVKRKECHKEAKMKACIADAEFEEALEAMSKAAAQSSALEEQARGCEEHSKDGKLDPFESWKAGSTHAKTKPPPAHEEEGNLFSRFGGGLLEGVKDAAGGAMDLVPRAAAKASGEKEEVVEASKQEQESDMFGFLPDIRMPELPDLPELPEMSIKLPGMQGDDNKDKAQEEDEGDDGDGFFGRLGGDLLNGMKDVAGSVPGVPESTSYASTEEHREAAQTPTDESPSSAPPWHPGQPVAQPVSDRVPPRRVEYCDICIEEKDDCICGGQGAEAVEDPGLAMSVQRVSTQWSNKTVNVGECQVCLEEGEACICIKLKAPAKSQ